MKFCGRLRRLSFRARAAPACCHYLHEFIHFSQSLTIHTAPPASRPPAAAPPPPAPALAGGSPPPERGGGAVGRAPEALCGLAGGALPSSAAAGKYLAPRWPAPPSPLLRDSPLTNGSGQTFGHFFYLGFITDVKLSARGCLGRGPRVSAGFCSVKTVISVRDRVGCDVRRPH